MRVNTVSFYKALQTKGTSAEVMQWRYLVYMSGILSVLYVAWL